jgi:hypothetical protein
MDSTRLHQAGLALLLGVPIGRLIGNLGFGFALSSLLLFALCLIGWHRRERAASRRQAQQLAVLSALTQQAIRSGAVLPCHACLRPVAQSGRHCHFCGTLRQETALR